MPKFKKGDTIVCIEGYNGAVIEGEKYTVLAYGSSTIPSYEGLIKLLGSTGRVQTFLGRRFELVEEVEEQWTPKVGELIRVVGNRSSVRRFFVAFTHVGTLITTKEQGHLGLCTMCKFWGESYKAHRIEEFKPKKRIWSLAQEKFLYV